MFGTESADGSARDRADEVATELPLVYHALEDREDGTFAVEFGALKGRHDREQADRAAASASMTAAPL